ncbi:hypothetical protein KP509_26G058000 [Ceratopteris richardii]|uniref:C2H2-type domain-containing protein n=1 Tax=Ceratopteris richardii TaxID=49495 RepID=A0A8T2RMB9_CERRI|nr:hypothetical protein KP509_26G058000 [Ceratopteris richardii]
MHLRGILDDEEEEIYHKPLHDVFSPQVSACSPLHELHSSREVAVGLAATQHDLSDLFVPVNPPTMHPKLVATLRSLLTPLQSPLGNEGQRGPSVDGEKDMTVDFTLHGVELSAVEARMSPGKVERCGPSTLKAERAGMQAKETVEKKKEVGDCGLKESGSGEKGKKREYMKLRREISMPTESSAQSRKEPDEKWDGGDNEGGARTATGGEGTVDEEMEATVVPVDLIRNRRPFLCGYEGCNKTFKNPQTMKMHNKTHYPGTEVCRPQRRGPRAAFTEKTDGASLVAGSGVAGISAAAVKGGHNKKMPSRCPLCRKPFVGLYELRRHFGRKHSDGEKAHACRKCSKRFYIEVDLRDHEKLCGEPILCKCGMKFAFKCNLVTHKKAHPECQDPPPYTQLVPPSFHYDHLAGSNTITTPTSSAAVPMTDHSFPSMSSASSTFASSVCPSNAMPSSNPALHLLSSASPKPNEPFSAFTTLSSFCASSPASILASATNATSRLHRNVSAYLNQGLYAKQGSISGTADSVGTFSSEGCCSVPRHSSVSAIPPLGDVTNCFPPAAKPASLSAEYSKLGTNPIQSQSNTAIPAADYPAKRAVSLASAAKFFGSERMENINIRLAGALKVAMGILSPYDDSLNSPCASSARSKHF